MKGTTQELIANEVLELVAKKLGKDVADHLDYRVIIELMHTHTHTHTHKCMRVHICTQICHSCKAASVFIKMYK